MSSRTHVVITGTGRTGTTFLVELLTCIGLDTGYNMDDIITKKKTAARAGLEHDIRLSNCPYIVKNPLFCDYAKEVLARKDIIIEHVFIPVRDLHAAEESRRYVSEANFSNMPLLKKIKRTYKPKGVAGGLWDTHSKARVKQEEILLQKTYKLVLALSDTSVPVTLMRYPRIVNDCKYLFEKLKPILGDMNYDDFSSVFNKTVRLDMVHRFSTDDC